MRYSVYATLGLLIGLVFALGVVEIGVRLFAPQPPLMYQPDPTLGWVHPANQDVTYMGNSGPIRVHFNSKGLRDVEHSYEKSSNTYRVLLLGDSYAEGVDVELENTFAKKLEFLFNAKGISSEVINSGVGGYGTDQAFIYYTREGWKYNPDLVILALTIENDISDNQTKGYCKQFRFALECKRKRDSSPQRMFIAVNAWAQNNFQSYLFVRKKMAQIYSIRRLFNRLNLLETKDTPDMRRRLPSGLSILLRQEPADISQGWQLTLSILNQLSKAVEQYRARLVIVLIPSRIQAEKELLLQALATTDFAITDLDIEKPNKILRNFGTAHGIPVIDLLPAFLAAASRGEQLSAGHWNRAGHALAAEIICQEIISATIVPELKACG